MHAGWKHCVEHGYRIEETLSATTVPLELTWSPQYVFEHEGLEALCGRRKTPIPNRSSLRQSHLSHSLREEGAGLKLPISYPESGLTG
jgi:hypothetical protein